MRWVVFTCCGACKQGSINVILHFLAYTKCVMVAGLSIMDLVPLGPFPFLLLDPCSPPLALKVISTLRQFQVSCLNGKWEGVGGILCLQADRLLPLNYTRDPYPPLSVSLFDLGIQHLLHCILFAPIIRHRSFILLRLLPTVSPPLRSNPLH